MQCPHGDRNKYFIVGEGVVDLAASLLAPVGPVASGAAPSLAVTAAAQPAATPNQELKYKFGWISERTGQKYADADAMMKALVKLGGCMNDPQECHNQAAETEPADSTLPSGYTYLGQFLAHEITFDREPSPTPDSYRSPEIDLDCLYGSGPAVDGRLFQDHARLKIDATVPIDNLNNSFQNDLPREHVDPQQLGRALIVDPRNDENPVVAQTQVAFIKFHNHLVDELSSVVPADQLFARAREEVTKHFQWIILKDYLPRIVGQGVMERLRKERLKGYRFESPEDLFIPLEFSAAAFRIGHSMVRDRYLWNSYHPSPGLADLFNQTRFSGQSVGLPSDWVIDWRHFYDFKDFPVYPAATLNMAKRVDTVFNLHIEKIANFPLKKNEVPRPITVRNLTRGFDLGLPTGEEMAKFLEVPALDAGKLRSGQQKHLLEDPLFDERTPLWYYILREAELETESSGLPLGPVGGLIVAGTLVEIMRQSPYSILRDTAWRPKFGRFADGDGPTVFEMTDLLHVADVVSPIGKHQNYS